MNVIRAAVVALLCVASVEAGTKSVSRVSSRTQARSGSYGHFVGVPSGHYEGVAVGSTRREAIRNSCFYGQKRIVSKSTARGTNGMFYSSVLYKNR